MKQNDGESEMLHPPVLTYVRNISIHWGGVYYN